MTYTSSERAMELLKRSAKVRVYSRAFGAEDVVMAEGEVIGYCAAPTLLIRHADGSKSSWSVDLNIEEVEPDWPKRVPYRIYSRWVQAGDRSSKAVWLAIQEAHAAGREGSDEAPSPSSHETSIVAVSDQRGGLT